MLRPKTYEKVVLPVDLWLRAQFKGRFMLHHCGIFHPYVEVYKPLYPTELDLGWGTDLRVARAAFPGPADVHLYRRICLTRDYPRRSGCHRNQDCQRRGPWDLLTSIVVAEIGPDISDGTVRDLMTAGERIKT